MDLNRISSEVISAAVAVHRELGPGLLESVYQSCMIVELHQRGFGFESEVAFPVLYRGIMVNDEGFRLDLIVENSVIVELKSIEKVLPVHHKQLLTYLRLTKKPLGLLINFNATKLVDGITRIANNL